MLHLSLLAVIARFVVYSVNVYEKINSFTANGLLIITKDLQRLRARFSHTHLCNLETPERGDAKLGRQFPAPSCLCPSACVHTHTRCTNQSHSRSFYQPVCLLAFNGPQPCTKPDLITLMVSEEGPHGQPAFVTMQS